MDNTAKNIEEYIPNKKQKILIHLMIDSWYAYSNW